ncbi:PREDICTED: zinc finger CCCH domain-containing protein 11A-like isoform X2 [Nicrophorus vespilloides]|nr:PREDICTED: zinc finger CCCH domain-containing protein 11A-like isoform X2 [Nicrophorus vespilloides]
MTDLESPRKNNDCYFYYYSTCTKGDNCTFRHEPSALGCETTCSFWKEGKCINVHCNFRHMELRKNRKSIPCYWEAQPGGCKKPHCPFMHASSKALSDGESSDIKSPDPKEIDLCSKSNDNYAPVVDPLVVNFEEESDNESAPTQSPTKKQRIVNIKTLEEIKLEKIQAESAAYYSYADSTEKEDLDAEKIRIRIMRRINSSKQQESTENDISKIQILSLEEIRKRKQRNVELIPIEVVPARKQKIVLNKKRNIEQLDHTKVYSLNEIVELENKTAKRKCFENEEPYAKLVKLDYSDSEVSSTSKIEGRSSEESSRIQCVVSPVIRNQSNDSTNNNESYNSSIVRFDSNKLDDLLLEDDDYEMGSVNLKAEEDILKDIDNLLND